MLVSLRIQNLALVEDLSLEFGPGFTVLTGETGAGKSLLVDALSLLLGARGDQELVRQGTDRTVVEGVVEGHFTAWNNFLMERGLPEEQPVVIRREVSAGSRSRAWINGASCSLADLREGGRIWMRLASQHDHQSLLAGERHLGLVDELLGIEPDLQSHVAALKEAEATLKALRRSASEREDRLIWLSEQLAELDKLDPKHGEWNQLRAEREPLRHAALLEQSFREAWEALKDAVPATETAQRALLKAAGVLPDVQAEGDRLRSALLEMEDILALTQERASHWARMGADRIEVVEARLALFERISRRHHCEPDELSSVRTTLKAEEGLLLDSGPHLAEREQAFRAAAEAYRAAAEKLHDQRLASLPRLEKETQRRINKLGMKHARIQIRLALAEDVASPVCQCGVPVRVASAGFSAVSIWMEPNVGEGFKPLSRIASGGELSRVMLAFMGAGMALRQGEGEGITLILDEVDAGLGGETALSVGEAIHDLASCHQVLAVTHLAQVASRAEHHGRLSKTTRDGRTRSHLEWLQDSDRVIELARLLSGHPDQPEALSHARALMAMAIR